MENKKKVDWDKVWKAFVAATSLLAAIFSILSFGMTCSPLLG